MLSDELAATARFLVQTEGNGAILADLEATQPALTPAATESAARALVATLAAGAPANAEDSEAFRASLSGCIHVVISLTHSVCGMSDEIVDLLTDGFLAAPAESFPEERLRATVMLYNLTAEGQPLTRYRVFLQLVRLAAKLSRLPALLPSMHAASERFVTAAHWDLDVPQIRTMYDTIVEALHDANMTKESYYFNGRRLATYQGCKEEELDGVGAAAADAVSDAIRTAGLYRFDDLLDLDAVQQLEKSSNPTYAALYKLLVVFVGGMLADYVAFRQEHAAVLEELKIDDALCLEKMRLLTFTSLARDCQDVKYEEVSRYLEISSEQVEEWIIRGIRAGLVDAKMNQVTQTVTVHRASQRSFTKDQWDVLLGRVKLWERNVSDLLRMLRLAKPAAAKALADAAH